MSLTERLVGAAGAALALLPRSWAYGAGRGLGLAAYLAAGRRRRLAGENIRLALGGELGPRGVRSLARESFANLGVTAVEFLLFPHLKPGELEGMVEVSGWEHAEEAVAPGRGVLVLTLHLGNWEVLAAAFALRGHAIGLVSKTARNSALDRYWRRLREAKGVRVFTGRGVMKDILRYLQKGGAVGFVLDQYALRADGVFVPFFGRPASTLGSLAIIARRTGAPVLPVYSYREGRRHRVVFEPVIPAPEPAPGREDVVAMTRAYSAWMEKAVRAHPEQWTWLHNRWKNPPEGPAGPAPTVAGEGGED